jgi:predicted glycosyltransferase involved in capsule biosynthesis
MYDFHLIVTSRIQNGLINRFLESVEHQSQDLNIIITYINQGGGSLSSLNYNIKIIEIKSEKTSISKARNLGLTNAIESKIIAFPDDDCWYEKDLLVKTLCLNSFRVCLKDDVSLKDSTRFFSMIDLICPKVMRL